MKILGGPDNPTFQMVQGEKLKKQVQFVFSKVKSFGNFFTFVKLNAFKVKTPNVYTQHSAQYDDYYEQD